MRCIYCSGQKTKVKNSRKIAHGTITWRRRHCTTCEKTFTTRETSVGDNLFVVKRNGSRQRFTYEKLFASIYHIVYNGKKRDSGDATKTSKKVALAVLEQIFTNNTNKNISTKRIVELSYKELRKVSRALAIAYGKYSEYRFKTLVQSGFMVDITR
jgi:transcriptional repressor NrdR